MNNLVAVILLLCLSAPVSAAVVTFGFTAEVDSATGIYSGTDVGTLITGSVTYENPHPGGDVEPNPDVGVYGPSFSKNLHIEIADSPTPTIIDSTFFPMIVLNESSTQSNPDNVIVDGRTTRAAIAGDQEVIVLWFSGDSSILTSDALPSFETIRDFPMANLLLSYDVGNDGIIEGELTATVTQVVPIPTAIEINIRPGNSANFIDTTLPDSKLINVGIMSTSEFDATQVVGTTVRFGPGAAEPADPAGVVKDLDGDGDNDFRLRFPLGETGIACEEPDDPVLTGQLGTGEIIEGSDFVTTPDCPTGVCHP
jgi:hypothetical protein